MRMILFANGDVGEHTIRFLIDNYAEDLAALVTIPDEGGRLEEIAAKANIPVIPFQHSDQFLRDIGSILPLDLGILAWWPKIIKKEIISLAKSGFINFHPSLLPYNRGKNYNFWCLVEGVPFGVTLHLVDEGTDTGPILFQREIHYDWTDTGGSLFFKAQREIVNLFVECYPAIRQLKLTMKPQLLDQGSFHFAAEMLSASVLDLEEKVLIRTLLNKLRARTFPGHPACSFEEAGKHYEVRVSIEEIPVNK